MDRPQPRLLRCTVPPEKDGRTVKSLLKSEFHMAEGYIAALKLRPDGIRLDGERMHSNVPVHAGQVLTARVDDPERNAAAPIPCPLAIVYEDEDLAVIDKPAGMLVHGPEGQGAPTLANALAARWDGAAFHPIHRLDRGTSGLIVVGKSRYVSELLRRSLHTEDFIREYLALAAGQPEPASGSLTMSIGPCEGERLRRCVRSDGQAARTDYETLAVFPGGSLLRLRLFTGRSHQIRVHLAAIGHPLYGDTLYGGPAELPRPALHSAFLHLHQPVTGELLTLHSPLPPDLQSFLDKKNA